MSITSFAAIVSDNDGAAFITKAEFDALKNNFQSQIDSYNTSIDNKIDGAIASYLAGIQLSTTTEEHNVYNDFGNEKILWVNDGWSTSISRPRWEVFGDICNWFSTPGDSVIRSQNGWTGPYHRTQYAYTGTNLPSEYARYLQFDNSLGFPRLESITRYGIAFHCMAICVVTSGNVDKSVEWDFSPVNDNYNDLVIFGGTATATDKTKNVKVMKDNVEDLTMLAFGNAGDADSIFCLNNIEKERLKYVRGDSSWDMPHDESVTKGWQWQGTSHFFVKNISLKNFADFEFENTSTFKPIDELYNGKSTNEFKVKLYEGIPIFKASGDGHVTIEGCSGTLNSQFAVSDVKFGKATPVGLKLNITGGSVSEYSSTGKYYYKINSTAAFKIDFDVEKNKIYYVKSYLSTDSAMRQSHVFKMDGSIKNQLEK